MKKRSWLKSIACVLCIALLLPGFTALAANDGEAPELTLICPQPSGSAAISDQKFIWQASTPITAQDDKLISVQEKDDSSAAIYTVAAKSNAVAITGGQAGPWLITLAMGSLTSDGSNAFLANAGKSYIVSIAEGAFTGAGNKPCAKTSYTFSLNASEESLSLVTYTLPQGWKVESVSNDTNGTRSMISCGGAVADGTRLTASGEIPAGKLAFASVATPANTTPESKAINGQLDLTVAGNTHISVTLQQGTLSGAASIVNAAAPDASASYVPAFGDSIKGVYTGNDVGSNTAHLLYTFSYDDTQLQSGASDTYAIQQSDIGKSITLTITSSVYSGKATVSSAVVAKQTVSPPAAPTIASSTSNSVTLNAVTGCEYSIDGTNFQKDASFSGLSSGQTYTFYQRFAETDTAYASINSIGLATQLGQAELTGTVTISGTPRAGHTLSAAITDSNNTGTLTYNWFRDGALAGSGANYTAATADIGKVLTVEVTSSVQTGKRIATTAVIGKTEVSAPAAPILASSTSNSITLVSVSGCEYSIDNTNWQNTATFNNLLAGQAYTFYQRFKATDMLDASASSSATFTTVAAQSNLTGTLSVSGDVRYGKTLVATLTGANSTGTPTFTWYRGATAIGTGNTYDISSNDIGYPLYVQVVCAGIGGSITKLVGTVQRADYVGIAPTAPTRESRTTSRITLTPHTGYEYSRDGKTWQSSNVFSGLSAGKTYKFYQRVAATASMEASPASDALKTSTNSSESSSSGSSSSGSSSSGSSSSGSSSGSESSEGSAPTGSGALYTFATTGENTRILFSTMERLVTGNKTQDVTITSGNIQFRFFKGTMQLSEGTLWYDFGTELNGAELMNAAKAIAGDSVVATVHFNHSGELPAKANIRIALDGSQAGKALYYYRLENGSLTYIQTAIADISGAVTVVQSSCSDYVLLDRDFFAAEVTPSPTPEVSASPTPLAAEGTTDGGTSSGGGWFIVLVIIAALLLIVVGILFYLKSRQANALGSDFNDFDEYSDDDPDDDPDGGSDYLDDNYEDYEDTYDPYQDDMLDDSYSGGSYGNSANTKQAPYSSPLSKQTSFEPHEPYTPPQHVQAQPTTPVYRAAPSTTNTAPNAVYAPAFAPNPTADENAQENASPLQNETAASAPENHNLHGTATHSQHTPDVAGKYPRARYRP